MSFMRVNRSILLALIVAMAGWQASARTILLPAQPVSPFADTEVSTNEPLHVVRTDVRDMKIHIQLEGTPTNDLEVAFGRDANTNGVLDVSEIETAYGWRTGRYFVENIRAWERIETGSVAGTLCGVIDIHVENGETFVPKRFSSTCGGEAAFGSLSTTPPAWLFRLGWDVMRVVRRGAGPPAEWVRSDLDYSNFFLIVR